MHKREIVGATLALLLGSAAPLAAQSQARPTAARPAAAPAAAVPAPSANGEPELELVFEREVFFYPTGPRRDPFKPLLDGSGPRFEDLTLRGIIYSDDPVQSVVLLADAGGRIYRVRRGETVGNARVIDVQPMRVIFAVNNFGVVRQEILELKRKLPEGVDG